jgi:hypothetical protein
MGFYDLKLNPTEQAGYDFAMARSTEQGATAGALVALGGEDRPAEAGEFDDDRRQSNQPSDPNHGGRWT